MPSPTKPPWSGSWPEPPPEISATLPAHRAAGTQDEVLGGVDLDDVRVGLGQAGQALGDDVLDVVDELLHAGRSVGRHRDPPSGSVDGRSGFDGFAVAGLGDGGTGTVAVS